MEKKNIFYIIIGLLCLLVILLLLSRNLLPITEREQFIPASLVKITGEPLIYYSENDNYKYTITIPAEIEYTGKWEIDNKAINSVDVVSFITFKGVTKKASVDGEGTFLLTKSNPKFEGELSADIESYAGPMNRLTGSSYDGEMMMHESVLLTTETDEGNEGNFLVTLESAGGSIGSSAQLRGKARFSIECETDARYIELVDWVFCEEGSDWYPEKYNKCEQYVEICDGIVHIRLVGPTRFGIAYSGGAIIHTDRVAIEAEEGKPFEPGESVEVSFWRSSDCVNEYNEFDELLSHCTRDFLGYSFLESIV